MPNKEDKLDQSAENLNTLRKPLLEQDATKATNLDTLFDAVMDQKGGKSTSVSQREAIPEQGEETMITNTEEPQIEKALQPEDSHIPRPEGTADIIRDKPTELTCGIEEIPNYPSNAVDKPMTHGPEWPHLPQKVIDLLEIASGRGHTTTKTPKIPLKDREMNVQMPEIAHQVLPQGPLLSPLERMEHLLQPQDQNTESECMVVVDHGPRKGMTPTLFPFTTLSGPMD